jgi:signal transduction histidine kinase
VGLVRGFARLRQWQAIHPRRSDALLALVVLAAALWAPLSGGGHGGGRGDGPLSGRGVEVDVLTVVLVAAAAAALVLRRSHPLQVWAVTLVAAVALLVHAGEPLAGTVLLCTALYTVGTRCPVRTTVGATLVTAVVFAGAMTAVERVFSDQALSLLAFTAVAAAVGVAVRSQRAAVEAAEARARQAETTREEEAERRVTDERLRIARELHDVLAHHISVINVQAGVARHLLDTRPDEARTAIGLVRAASRTVLTEMSAVLGLLRSGDDETPVEPAPGLDQLPALVDGIRRAGLATTWRVEGAPSRLPEIADLAAYRIVQESLTNALRHGTGTAELVLSYTGSGVVIEVRNPRPADAPPSEGAGHGLVGMRERVAAVGGRFAAGAEGADGFVVRAEIPGSRS